MSKSCKRWTNEETKAFLHFYAARKDEFSHPRKKRFAFGNVLEDLIAAGFDSTLTPRHLEVKMQTLLRAYRDAKDNNSRTGASPCMGPFMGEMEELFGNKPIHSKSESFNLGSESIHSNADAPVSLLASSDTPTAARSFSCADHDVEEAPTWEAFEEDFASASLEAAFPSNSSNVVAVSPSPVLSSSTPAATSSTTTTITKPAKPQKNMSRSDYFFFFFLCFGAVMISMSRGS